MGALMVACEEDVEVGLAIYGAAWSTPSSRSTVSAMFSLSGGTLIMRPLPGAATFALYLISPISIVLVVAGVYHSAKIAHLRPCIIERSDT